jgi:hypothetical protein
VTMKRRQRLRDAGVSIWLDMLSRELLETGEFTRLVRDLAASFFVSRVDAKADRQLALDSPQRPLWASTGPGVVTTMPR